MKKSLFTIALILFIIEPASCSEIYTPIASLTPDNIVTREVEARAIAATLTAEISTATLAPLPTNTQTPTITKAPLPTNTQIPIPLGMIQGRMIGKSSQQRLASVWVVPCLAADNNQETTLIGGFKHEDSSYVVLTAISVNYKGCRVGRDFAVKTDSDGHFSLANIPFGKYLLLYSLRENIDPKMWENITLALPIELEYPILLTVPPEIPWTGPISFSIINDPFGGQNGVIISPSWAGQSIRDAHDLRYYLGVSVMEGAITSKDYGLTLEIVVGKPVPILVENVEPIVVVIMVSDQ